MYSIVKDVIIAASRPTPAARLACIVMLMPPLIGRLLVSCCSMRACIYKCMSRGTRYFDLLCECVCTSHGGLLREFQLSLASPIGGRAGWRLFVHEEEWGQRMRKDMEPSLMILHVCLESNCSFGFQRTDRNDLWCRVCCDLVDRWSSTYLFVRGGVFATTFACG